MAFKIEKHTAKNNCGATASTYCFIVLSYPNISEPCTGGGAITGPYGGLSSANLSSKGTFHYHKPLQGPADPLEDETVVAQGHHVSGTFREESQQDNGSGVLQTCDTGTMRWTSPPDVHAVLRRTMGRIYDA